MTQKRAKNVGKIFEDNWKSSCPNNVFLYRPPDAAQSFYPNSELKFSNRSLCDFLMYDGRKLYVLELKTTLTNFTFERTEDDCKRMIHWHQIETLNKISQYPNTVSGFLLDYRNSGNTYFIGISDFLSLINCLNKNSFTEHDMLTYSSVIEIEKKLLKVNYRCNVSKFLDDANHMED